MENLTVVWQWGPLGITRPVLTTWAVMAALALVLGLSTQRLQRDPGRWQTVLEGVVNAVHAAIEEVLPGHGDRLLPFIGTLWIFIGVTNLVGVLPGASSPTADLSTTAALAVLVFLSVHWYGIRSEGWRAYLGHYLEPSIVMLPFHLISEISRTVALAVRLFGNVMSLETAALLVLLVAGLLVPVPVLLLHIVEALVQAYIFGMLALVYISGGIHARRTTQTGDSTPPPDTPSVHGDPP
jgi:F-type H+-transporting ATPase subunit a